MLESGTLTIVKHHARPAGIKAPRASSRREDNQQPGRTSMPTFMMSLNWTNQGIRAIKDSPKRSDAARDLAKKVGVEIKHLYLTSGDSDLVIFVEALSGDNVAKFALAVGSLGNVRTRTARAWSAEEYRKIISELP
jgi:uncharacterized protein with GYD domain